MDEMNRGKSEMSKNYQIMQTVICDDCMHGHHSVIGHNDCECACHNNPQCWICGHNVFGDDIRAGSHISCLNEHVDAECDAMLDQMLTKYGEL